MKITVDRNEFYKLLFLFIKDELEQDTNKEFLDDDIKLLFNVLDLKNFLTNLKQIYPNIDILTRNKYKFINKSFNRDSLKSIIEIIAKEE
jgi:DNA-binding MltR family transcriptional regulator